jgi:hypothetical protein
MPCFLSCGGHARQTKGQGGHIYLFRVGRNKKDSHCLKSEFPPGSGYSISYALRGMEKMIEQFVPSICNLKSAI